MFENLSERLSSVFDRLTKQGALSEDDVKTALREVRVALLEADVSLSVAREFVKKVQAKATGSAVTKSVTPGQQVIKIVHDALIDTLRGEGEPGDLKIDNPPTAILMVGLQGSGKTTTSGKLAKRLSDREGKKVLMASLDIYRPAAMEQLAILGTQVGVDTLPIVIGETAVQIAKRAKQQATLGGYDVYMLDTAGRLQIDTTLMQEVEDVRDVVSPRETLLVVDGLTGQIAVEVAEEFDGKIGITGVVLTRMMRRLQKGMFNMNDLRSQLEQMQKMGGMQGLMGMMPGMAKMKGKIEDAGLDDSLLKRQIALISSMTKKERANPSLLQASRKKRIAAGSGMEVSDLNKLLKQHRQMADMMKKLGKRGGLGALKGMMGGQGAPSPAELAAAQEQITSGAMGGGMPKGMSLPKGMGGLSGFSSGLPSGLSGLGKKK